MGIRLAVDKIAALISAASPLSEVSRPYILAEDDGSVRPDIIEHPSTGTTRMFVVRPSDAMPSDDGEAGTPAGRLTAIIETKVVYLYSEIDKARRFDLAQEDCAVIQRAIQNHIAWDCATTGIVSIAPAQSPSREPLDQGDREIGFVLVIPHPVTYREVAL